MSAADVLCFVCSSFVCCTASSAKSRLECPMSRSKVPIHDRAHSWRACFGRLSFMLIAQLLELSPGFSLALRSAAAAAAVQWLLCLSKLKLLTVPFLVIDHCEAHVSRRFLPALIPLCSISPFRISTFIAKSHLSSPHCSICKFLPVHDSLAYYLFPVYSFLFLALTKRVSQSYSVASQLKL